MDVSLGAAVAVGIAHQVGEKACEQLPVPPDRNPRRRLPGEGDPLLPDERQVGALCFEQRAQVHPLQGIALGLKLQAGEIQHILDKTRHLFPLACNHLECFPVLLGGSILLQRQLALRQDHAHGRAQLMGGVGGELPLGLKCLVQPGEHGVELPGQLVELVASPSQLDSLVEVAAGADLRRCGGDLLHGTQHPARDEIPAHNGGKHQEGHEYQGHLRNVGELHLALGLGHRAPEPQPGESRLGQGAVVDIVEHVPGGDLLDHLILKG